MATRLRLAVDTGDVARLRDLAANGANLSGHVPSLVLCAVMSGQPGIIDCLRELNAPMDVGAPAGSGAEGSRLAPMALFASTPARGSGDPNLVIAVLASLRDAGVDLEEYQMNRDTNSVLHMLLSDEYIYEAFHVGKEGMHRGADASRVPVDVVSTNFQDTTARTRKTWWTPAARLKVVRWLLEAGVDPDLGYPSKGLPSLSAALCGNLEGLKLLRSHGADMSRGVGGLTVVGAALRADAKNVVKWLSKECGVVSTRSEIADAEAAARRRAARARGAAAAAPTPPKKSGQAYAVARLCGYCGRTGAKNQCGKCGSLGPRFCGPACFKRAWPSHKKVCGTAAGKDREPLLVELASAVLSGDVAAIERLVKTDKVPVDAEIAHIIGDSSMSRSINASAHKSEAEDPLCKQGLVVGKANSMCGGGETALLLASLCHSCAPMVQMTFPNWSADRKRRAHLGFDSAKVIRCLANLGADLERRTRLDDYGLTPFLSATRGSNHPGLEALKAVGADVNAKAGFDGSSALAMIATIPAAMGSTAATLRVLRSLGCDPNQRDNYFRLPIEMCTVGGDCDKVRALVDMGANADWPRLWEMAQVHPMLAQSGRKAAMLRCLDELSQQARGKPASAALAVPGPYVSPLFRAAAAAAPEKGHRHWACQLKRVDIASVKELRAMILAAGGTDRGLIEKSELRARARECLAAKLEPEETAEEVD